jgi:hypothetical protein
MAGLDVRLYEKSRRQAWDGFVRRSKNGTLLFERGYMDYHSDRSEDCSLVVLDEAQIVALLPAASKPFFDFGISTGRPSRVLNRGLIEQKEGFGAHAVVHDSYRMKI